MTLRILLSHEYNSIWKTKEMREEKVLRHQENKHKIHLLKNIKKNTANEFLLQRLKHTSQSNYGNLYYCEIWYKKITHKNSNKKKCKFNILIFLLFHSLVTTSEIKNYHHYAPHNTQLLPTLQRKACFSCLCFPLCILFFSVLFVLFFYDIIVYFGLLPKLILEMFFLVFIF